jgi:hypothetical protein
MQRLCQKPYCELPSIPRGKYCEIHRIKKKNKRNIELEQNFNTLRIREEIDIERKLLEKQKILEEERIIRQEQEEAYKNALEADRKRLEETEYENILKLSKDKYFEDLKNKLLTRDIGGEYYNIKIQFPAGLHINNKFSIDSIINDIREYIDLYIYENNINIINYDLILNYPYKKFTTDDRDLQIKKISNVKNFILYLSNLDA